VKRKLESVVLYTFVVHIVSQLLLLFLTHCGVGLLLINVI